MKFSITATDPQSSARAGELELAHGRVPTPVFMPVGTLANVKTVHFRELREDIDSPMMLSNTYHLYLRPGTDILRAAGGIHRFTGWERPVLTDSGGFQVYSLAQMRKLTEAGVVFQSHIDGSRHHFTAAKVMDIQRTIGADIIMAFDECTPYPCEKKYASDSMALTHRWLKRCCEAFDGSQPNYDYEQDLFPIVQGSVYPDLRRQSAEVVAGFERAGNAIGGLSVGEPAEEMYAMTELTCRILPADKPRYLMGVGTPGNLLESIALGVDMFDCVIPTRNGRNGMLFTRSGIINIKNEQWKADFSPLDEQLDCFVSQQYSKAFVRHLFAAREFLGKQIASLQNLAFYRWLMGEARGHIVAGDFTEWKSRTLRQVMQRL